MGSGDWRDLEHIELLPPGISASMIADFIESDLQDPPLPASGAEWLAGRRLPAMQAFDMLQVAQFCHAQLPGFEVTIDARSTSSLGWPAFFAGACAEDVFHSGTVKITSSLPDSSIPRLPGILGISDIAALWTQININP
jgi:hypothetical protein